MCILVYVFFFSLPPPAVEAVVSGWAVLMMVWKQEVTARPKETHLQPEIEIPSSPPPDTSSPPFLPLPKTKNKTNKHCHSNPPLPPPRGQCIPYQGWPHQPLHKHAHTQSHTAASQSLCPGEVCFCFFLFFFSFFVFFSLFWGSLLLLLGKGKGLFHCVCLYFFNMGTEIGGEVW